MLLEGIEVVFIVIAVGASQALSDWRAQAPRGGLSVAVVGAAIHRPLSRVPENALKFAVGVMLSAFGCSGPARASRRMAGGRSAILAFARCFSASPRRWLRFSSRNWPTRMIRAIVAQLVGLFVDDGFLAAAILAAVAVASALMLAGAPAWVAGSLLTLALPAALAASVVLAARLARRERRSGP